MFGLAGRTIAVAAVGIGVVLAIAFMWVFSFGFFQRSTAEQRGSTAANERVVADPNFRIASYNRFFDLCSAVKTKETAIQGRIEAGTGTILEFGGEGISYLLSEIPLRIDAPPLANATVKGTPPGN